MLNILTCIRSHAYHSAVHFWHLISSVNVCQKNRMTCDVFCMCKQIMIMSTCTYNWHVSYEYKTMLVKDLKDWLKCRQQSRLYEKGELQIWLEWFKHWINFFYYYRQNRKLSFPVPESDSVISFAKFPVKWRIMQFFYLLCSQFRQKNRFDLNDLNINAIKLCLISWICNPLFQYISPWK
jgi:hypothetical protein